MPTEDKSSQAQIANFDRAEAGYVAEQPVQPVPSTSPAASTRKWNCRFWFSPAHSKDI